MYVLQRLRSLLIITLLLSGSGIAFGQAADPLRQALTDLTTNIDAADDAEFQRATEIMLNALQSIAPERNNYGTDCFVWGQPTTEAPKTYSLLSTAFLAGAARERIYGEPSDALYQAWLNVIRYYSHYRRIGSMPEYEPIERLAKLEQAGQLRSAAQSVQAKHPPLFDRIVLGQDVARFAREHVWDGYGTVELNVPDTWLLTEATVGIRGYTFMMVPKDKASAALTLIFMQHRKRTGDTDFPLRVVLQNYVKPTAVFATEKRPKFEPMSVNGAKAQLVRLSGDAIVGQPPVDSRYRIAEVALVALDDYCDLYAVKQMDQVGMPESGQMDAILQSASLRRTGPPAIVHVKQNLIEFAITSPASKLRLVLPNRELTDVSELTGDLRSFHLIDRGDGLDVSGSFQPEAQFQGIAKFWENDNRGDQLHAKHVEIAKVSGWDVVLFENQVAFGIDGNFKAVSVTQMRAERAQAGTWIDLHCALSRIGSSDKSRKALLKFLKQVKVESVSAQ